MAQLRGSKRFSLLCEYDGHPMLRSVECEKFLVSAKEDEVVEKIAVEKFLWEKLWKMLWKLKKKELVVGIVMPGNDTWSMVISASFKVIRSKKVLLIQREEGAVVGKSDQEEIPWRESGGRPGAGSHGLLCVIWR